MKRFAFIPVIAVIALAGCSQKLSDQDRALLTDTRAAAEQAKAEADQAAVDAKAAREAAEKAEADASTASTRSDRMFQATQNK